MGFHFCEESEVGDGYQELGQGKWEITGQWAQSLNFAKWKISRD